MCSRRAKRLILLKRHEADHLFVEARRAELLETYLVLVISDLVDATREVLKSAARAGFRELDHESLRGLPRGWTAFQNVQLERVPSTSIDDLTPASTDRENPLDAGRWPSASRNERVAWRSPA